MALLKYLHVGKAGESIEWASETMCTVVDVDAIPGGIQSEPPDGYLEVTNVYYNPETQRMVVVYKGV